VGGFALGAPDIPAVGETVTIGNDEAELREVAYDFPNPGQSTWVYRIKSGRKPNISHTNFQLLCPSIQILDAGVVFYKSPAGLGAEDLKSKVGSP
jgi:hypothetical protein